MISNNVTGSEKPVRINRLVSVILNGVPLNRLAAQNGNDVYGMANALMAGTSDTVKRNILSHERPMLEHSLRKEIRRRTNINHTL
ncbi:hypothetical protein [Leptolinea tardivitalis]|uniref:Uncharacterized protein n=1 Tax=Leptolinea tardivitalis TaxID=229920 RepID=A0A0N8GLT8_9CHLR|nr:hypothetical protein [Leptolinea tardivitalis]KPL73418.1 hypothetical protein ADM99_04270 [Leptolinea tardivitalis]GAP21577.1 hypothetical protein LTAR_01788 [Leptolinea tardivitalis]